MYLFTIDSYLFMIYKTKYKKLQISDDYFTLNKRWRLRLIHILKVKLVQQRSGCQIIFKLVL